MKGNLSKSALLSFRPKRPDSSDNAADDGDHHRDGDIACPSHVLDHGRTRFMLPLLQPSRYAAR
jgi:hypothetical protein